MKLTNNAFHGIIEVLHTALDEAKLANNTKETHRLNLLISDLRIACGYECHYKHYEPETEEAAE